MHDEEVRETSLLLLRSFQKAQQVKYISAVEGR